MAFSTIQLLDEPIVIIAVDLPFDRHLASLQVTNSQLTHLAAQTDGLLYFVFDIGQQDIGFSDILIGIDELDSDPSSWINFSHVQLVIVGDHPMLRIARKRVSQQLHVDMTVYPTMDAALAAIRAEVSALDDEVSG